MLNLISFLGVFIIMFLAWLISSDRKTINLRLIFWGVGLQFFIAGFVFLFPAGTRFFMWLNTGVIKLLEAASKGTEFVFGRLALPPGNENSLGFILAFQALPAIIFFSALMGILYFLGIMQWIIKAFARVFTKLMGVSGAESLCTASNIFVGIESVLTIKPFLRNMTTSELHTILTAGMATVASNVLAIYVFTLKDLFPGIAGHLISASLLSAPAALVISKLVYPEKEKPETLGMHVEPHYERESSIFETIITSSMEGVKLIVGIVALLISVLGLVALVDMLLGWIGGLLHLPNLSLKTILKFLYYPLTLILGVPPGEAGVVAGIIGERMIVTEVVGYQDLATALSDGLISMRTAVITAYALCGFAHFASMAIFVGGISALVPERRKDLARVGFRALISAILTTLMTGAVAGLFYAGRGGMF